MQLRPLGKQRVVAEQQMPDVVQQRGKNDFAVRRLRAGEGGGMIALARQAAFYSSPRLLLTRLQHC